MIELVKNAELKSPVIGFEIGSFIDIGKAELITGVDAKSGRRVDIT